MNSVQLLGNLARDPEIRSTTTGKTVARFTVACSSSYVSATGEKREMTDFVPCVAWGNLAESCQENLAKGKRVFVQGRFSRRSYETQDGQKRYMTEVVCEFIGQPLGKGMNEPGMGRSGAQETVHTENQSFGDAGSLSTEEVPF
jgi:hypothetical protein